MSVANPEKRRNNPESVQRFRLDPEIANPCWKEHKNSLKCLDQNNYDYDKCRDYFSNYNLCKTFWSKVESDRKRKGVKPQLPPPEERAKIKEEYMNKGNL